MQFCLFIVFSLSLIRLAAAETSSCDEMQYYDVAMSMCMPLPMANMPMKMLMLQGNAFGVYDAEEGPRGRDAVTSTNMFMGDIGSSVGDAQYFNLDYMGTLERWTIPYAGYPELLQIGESNDQGAPFIDAQHPHSSPVMGLTLSDTIAFGVGKNNLKLFFAPRGEATEGPIPFMHRITAMVNPDAPLGHHVGQDVAHISSTVIGASLLLGKTHFEISTFNGTEPEPDAVNLPVQSPNSVAIRLIEGFSNDWSGMISASHVNNPEPDQPEITFENRYSTSLYWSKKLPSGCQFNNSFIYGMAQNYDFTTLSSFAEEFLLKHESSQIWGRIEVLQRTPAELAIATTGNPNQSQWIEATTLGYTHKILSLPSDSLVLGLGGSVTRDLLPETFIGAYGGNPWTGKVFLQLSGAQMFDL
jgi:hypothetical protein